MAGLWLGLLVIAGAAEASTARQTFRIIFVADPGSGTPGRVVATGPAAGVGTDVTTAQDPHPDGSVTATDLITLPGGTLTILDTDPPDIFHFNPLACVAIISGSGPYTITSGTGAYAGATGGGTFSAQGAVVFDRTPGGCSDQPRSFVATVSLSGTITLP